MAASPPELHVLRGGKPSRPDSGGERRDILAELYSKYGGSVYGRCRYLLKDESAAEDAMQEVFARAFTHHQTFRAEASPLTWLLKIATHHCLNVQRAARAPWWRRFEREQAHRSEGSGGPQILETRDWVRKTLARFDPETQAAAVHYHVDEMTLEEVAALLGRSVPTIRKRLEQFAAAAHEEE
jgi:RNA polymerase sigma-70 factor (ECF subfamily)